MKSLAILGSTGSIGRQALAVAEREAARIRVVGLAAGRGLDDLCDQARRFHPRAVALEHAADPRNARDRLESACPEPRCSWAWGRR